MGYKVLVTLDLPGANDKQREVFYEKLKTFNWAKIKNLTTAWKVAFRDDILRDDAIKYCISHLSSAKQESKVLKVEYGLQLDKIDLVYSTL